MQGKYRCPGLSPVQVITFLKGIDGVVPIRKTTWSRVRILVLLGQVLLFPSAGSLQNETVFKIFSNRDIHIQVCFDSLQDGLLACFSRNVFVYFHVDSYVSQCLSSGC